MKDFIRSFKSFFIGCTNVFGRKHTFCRNERRNWRLLLRRHVRRCTFRCDVRGNRWTDGCKQTRRMSKLLSPMHPLFWFLRSSVLVSHPSADVGPTLSRARTHTLSRSLRLFGAISLDSLDLLYLAYPAATVPHLYALIPVHTDSGYLRESIPRATFTLHNASDLCFFLRAASVTLFRRAPKGHSFSHKAFLIYKIRQEQCKHI